MKKVIYVLILLIIANAFSISVRSYNNVIPKSTVENYIAIPDDSVQKQNLKKDIIKSILNATGYSKWEEYIDYIDLKIYKGNVIPNGKENIVFALNLSKDTALVAVYEQMNDLSYYYKNKITNIVPVKDIKFFKNFLIIEQILDERVGAFLIDNFIQIFYYDDDNTFKSVLKKSVNYEEAYKAIWIDKNAPDNLWNKTTLTSSVDYLDEDPIKILYIATTTNYKGLSPNFPKVEDFKKESEKTEKYLYVWDAIDKSFKLQEKSDVN
ncbi:hypothetical protein [Alkalithermobacter paradoxus]|uniref:Uncharacterized protein n=1 Tax=Alkalithermobacter paradoxus TaxID=29349 RepID=A0A1V4I6G7_9FIRM|nr:hypothetical protein CLOTH_13410 [[Clostridium] thermoalcaliphilum]